MKYNKQIVKIKATITREPMEATTSPFKTSDDLENTFLRDNSRKKSYAEVLQEDNLQDFPLEAGNGEMEDQPYQDSDTEERSGDIAGQPGAEDGQAEETWEIHVPTELKRKLASLWQTSIIIKLMGRQLGYRALQTKLAGIWRPTGRWNLIDIGHSFFIVRFDLPQDYQHALMDGPWFVGDHYLHVQAWEADFHPHVAKISTTAVWIRLEQLPIEYYHPEFLKHMGNKLGKLLKIDAVTSASMRGRFARLCVQVNTAYPLPKRVKIRAFWQDIVYENLPMLCYRCGRIGHRESHCSKPTKEMGDTGM